MGFVQYVVLGSVSGGTLAKTQIFEVSVDSVIIHKNVILITTACGEDIYE